MNFGVQLGGLSIWEVLNHPNKEGALLVPITEAGLFENPI
jgi:hypothetical protein